MREGWTEATLGEIAEYQNGYPFKPAELGLAGLPVIRIKQLLDPAEPPDRSEVQVDPRHHINDEDLIFSWSGTLAVRSWDRGPALLNQHLFRVVERPGVDRSWLRLALDLAITALADKTHGSTMKHITKADLLPHPVVVPPLAEQRRIADLIGAIDAVRHASRGLARSAAVAAGVLVGDLLARDDCDMVPIRDLAVAGGLIGGPFGSDLRTRDYSTTGVPVINGANHSAEEATLVGPFQFVSEEKADQLRRNTAVPRDVVATNQGSVGQVSLVPRLPFDRYVVSQRQLRIRLDPDRAIPEYIVAILRGRSAQAELASQTVRTGVSHINLRIFGDLLVPLPSLGRQRLIAAVHSAAIDVSSAAATARRRLAVVRSSLLGDLLSGDHEIPSTYDRFLDGAA